jgi:hypothetical protein
MLDPIQRRRYGILALLLSMIFFGVAAAAGVGNAIRRQSVTSDISAATQECQNRLGTLGSKTVTATEDTITAEWATLDGGYNTLSSASSAALACPGWTMQSFCMGQGCTKPGATLQLKKATS